MAESEMAVREKQTAHVLQERIRVEQMFFKEDMALENKLQHIIETKSY